MSRGRAPVWLCAAFLVAPVSRSFAQVRSSGASGPRALEPGVPQVEAPPRVDDGLPPWTDFGDVPPPSWVRSIVPSRVDAAFYAEPGNLRARRGSAQLGARLSLFATRRGPGCQGRWLNVGAFAWICSDVADYSGQEPFAGPLGSRPWILPSGEGVRPPRVASQPIPRVEPTSPSDDGLPYQYFFAGPNGAEGFSSLENALDGAPDKTLEQGFAVAIVEERVAHGESWGRTQKGHWIAMRELVPSRPFLFHGEQVFDGRLDAAWVIADNASVFGSEKAGKAVGTRARFEKVQVQEEKGTGAAAMLRVGDGAWMRARDVARARQASPPSGIGEDSETRWIDVDLAQQTLVAYIGKAPVFATVVSTGTGAQGTDRATPIGTHRIWLKIFTTKMSNLDNEDVEKHYALEDVPWVQFFSKAVALHGAFWHRNFGHVHSHGCVNLAPIDARWLYAFTSPHLPIGWTAVFPTAVEQGTVIRVH